MARSNLDSEIQQAKDETLILGSMVEQAIMQSIKALRDHDMERSTTVLEYDKRINEKRYSIAGAVIATIATQQPMAHDLRILSSIVEICTELERIGDYAKGIASINLRSGGLSMPKMLQDLHSMAQKATDMLHRSLTAFVYEDQCAAKVIAGEDYLIDILYEQLYIELMDFVIEQPENIERANFILWAGHNLERMADRVASICVRVNFIKTGDWAVQFD